MLNRSKLLRILKDCKANQAPFRVQELLKADHYEIKQDIGIVDLARRKLGMEDDCEYLEVKDKMVSSVDGFYDFLDNTFKESYGVTNNFNPNVLVYDWSDIEGDKKDLAFKYRVKLRKDFYNLKKELVSVDLILKRFPTPFNWDILRDEKTLKRNLDNFYNSVDADFRKRE